MKKKISLPEVKQALLDERFRKKLPEELNIDIEKFLKNPGCACNHPIYKKVLKLAGKSLLAEYFPGMEAPDVDKEVEKFSRNQWTVINCNIHELSEKLKQLPTGRKQLEIARFEDQVTVVINELDFAF